MNVEYEGRGRKTVPYSALVFVKWFEKKLNIFCVRLENNIFILEEQPYHNLLFIE